MVGPATVGETRDPKARRERERGGGNETEEALTGPIDRGRAMEWAHGKQADGEGSPPCLLEVERSARKARVTRNPLMDYKESINCGSHETSGKRGGEPPMHRRDGPLSSRNWQLGSLGAGSPCPDP